jgi:16S rRNA (guanine966-N2)-methyltransferase
VRIIGGKYKSKVLKTPNNLPVRPTTDFAKESLFNILNNHISFEGICVLDLFAGTANLSIECLSRNAMQCVSVDLNFHCVQWMYQLKKELNITNWQIIKNDALKFVKRNETPYDLIIADPPYDWGHHRALAELICQQQLKDRDAIFILEHGNKLVLEDLPYYSETRKYGAVHFSFFKGTNN